MVDQGDMSDSIHEELGTLIAAAHPDKVVLMKHSVTDAICRGLKSGGYGGKLEIKTDPLLYYQSLEQLLANGDVALLQNDWPDSYN